MMIEKARVEAYQNGIALVQCYAKTSCGGCSAQTGCGTKALSALAGEKIAPRFELPVSQPLQAGDEIELGLPESTLLAGVFWLYGVPLMTLLFSTLLFSSLFHQEWQVFVAIIGCTGASFVWIKQRLARSTQHNKGFQPVFLRKL